MGIYITGMEMPLLPKVIAINSKGFVEDAMGRVIGRVVSVPDHGRLIDADALEHEFENLVYPDNWYYNTLRHAPTIIPAEP